jgi:hypothetical protein
VGTAANAQSTLKNPTRKVDTEKGVLTLTGQIAEADGALLTYTQEMQAVAGGVRLTVSFTTPNGEDAIGRMKNRYRPYGHLALPGREYSAARWTARTRNGETLDGAIAATPPQAPTAILMPDMAVRHLMLRPAQTKARLTVTAGENAGVTLEDDRTRRESLALRVHPLSDRTAFSQTIRVLAAAS